MKKIIVFTFLFVTVNVFAQNIPVDDTTAKPAITAIGKPDGEKIEMKIGKDGGSISSSDGKVTLVFPKGALSKKTNISIQPVTNLAPNGNGKAYQMEPSGTHFEQPATLIFHYTDEESKDSMQYLMSIAMQDNTGKWYQLKKISLDSGAKTISGNIKHFSAYVNFSKAKIDPASARVKVNGSKRLKIIGAFSDDTDEDEELAPLVIEYPAMKWSVNGIPNGNSAVGVISASHGGSAIFQAPAQIPAQNPVAVTVQPEHSSAFNNRYRVSRLVSNITIYDGDYEVKMISTMNGSAGSQLGAVKYKDYGSFIISLNENKAKVTEVVNKNAEFTYIGKCAIVQLKPGQGNINIIGVQGIRVIPGATPRDNPWVEIFFVRSPTVLPLLQFTCPNLKGGTFTTTAAQANAIGFSIPAFPMSIKFEAKEGEQTILKFGEEGGEIYARFTVKKITDE